ncbi:hypothetical protein [Micromonospora endolithica]|uniref:Alanine-rich protein n=1 Tax=Micromonospora endolithica TaxID=230091 RepID=A0A3A9ZTC0_9ACTN|nr:hypothetical protein [Micromonospora endolithica]RKN51194.1 hypothetical protein D7223_05690 [Micromonospora endolithica]TWJ22404.1 hypothetical protein JD76_02519 [Micromonospora endolithica]
MRPGTYAHPVSFRADPVAQAARLAAAGVATVRLAYAYHSGRWLLSTSDAGAVADLDAGRWFGPAGPAGRLDPPLVADLAGPATAALTAAGVRTVAWLVGLHRSAVATTRPDLALRNAFGHPYRHALCPARPEVVEHAADLVRRAAAVPGVTGLDLEAFGYLGWAHQGAHDKIGVALRPADRWLLSLCLCAACGTEFTAAGVDPTALAERVRAVVRGQLAEPRPAAPEPATDAVAALGRPLHDVVLAVRAAVVRRLVAAAVAAAGDTPVSLRATADPYATDGKAGGDLAGLGALTTGLTVSNLHGDLPALAADLAAARPCTRELSAAWSGAVAATPRRDRFTTAYDVALRAGADAFVLYAYDLMPTDRLDWLRQSARGRQEVPAA